MGELRQQGRPLRGLAVHGFGGVLGKGGVEGVRVLGLEKTRYLPLAVSFFNAKSTPYFFATCSKDLIFLSVISIF